jgi:hypothetical protein
MADYICRAGCGLSGVGDQLRDLRQREPGRARTRRGGHDARHHQRRRSWATNFAGHIAAERGQAAKQTKDEARSGLTAAIRPLVRRLQASSVVSDAEKASLGITVAQSPGRSARRPPRPSAPSSAGPLPAHAPLRG